jgi:hypothetical protein
MASKKNSIRKPNFTELMDSLTILCRAEKAAVIFGEWLKQATGNFEDSQTYLGQLMCQTKNPVIAMLAKQAMAAR